MTTVSAASAVAQNTNSTALGKLNDDFQSFIKLLTVQLQNQDPTEPLDTNQLTDQITQFSQVEQQINTNKSLTKLLEANQSNAINTAVSYIDRFVDFESAEFFHREGTSPILNYKLPEQAKTVNVSITTESGKVLHSYEGEANAGKNIPITWDGKDDNGNNVAKGKYKINIVAKNANGEDIKATTTVTDIVTEVSVENNEVQLTIGDIKIPAAQVKSVKGYYAEVDVADNTPEAP